MQQALPKVQVYAQVHMLWYMPRENRSADSEASCKLKMIIHELRPAQRCL